MTTFDPFTRWGVVAVGEGGGRAVSRLFVRDQYPGIDDRVLLLGTTRSDIRNVIDRVERMADADVENVGDRYAMEYGSMMGAANRPLLGEQAARQDIERIARRIQQSFGPGTDAFLYVTALGGGSGNGTVPYLVEELSGGRLPEEFDWFQSSAHVAFGIWPFDHESQHRHFNAVTGLSRLLPTDSGGGNSGLVLLVSNEQLATHLGKNTPSYDELNGVILEMFDAIVGAGRVARSVIMPNGFTSLPARLGTYHATSTLPATGSLRDQSLLSLFRETASKPAVPADPSTARAAFAIVQAGEDWTEDGPVTEPAVERTFDAWQQETGIDVPGMATLIPTGSDDGQVSVSLVLVGFDLDPLLAESMAAYESYRDALVSAEDDAVEVDEDRLDHLKEQLAEYRERF